MTALAATVKGKQNISIGNIVGANIINMSIIMGASTLVSSGGLIISRQTLTLDVPMATIVTLIFILFGILFERMGKLTGILFLGLYGGYLYILF